MAKLLQLYLQGAQNPLKLELEDPTFQFRSSGKQSNQRRTSMEDCYSGNCQGRSLFSSGKKRDFMMQTAKTRRSLSSQQKSSKRGLESWGNTLLDESLLKRTSTQCTPKREKLFSKKLGQFDTINSHKQSAERWNTENSHNQRMLQQSTYFSSERSSVEAISTKSQNNSEKEMHVNQGKIYQGWMKTTRTNDDRYSKWHESYDGSASRKKNYRMNTENKEFQETERKDNLGRNIDSLSLESKQSYSGLLCSLSPKQQSSRGLSNVKHKILYCNSNNKKEKRIVQQILYEPQNLDSVVNLSKKKTKLIIRPIKQANSSLNTSQVQNEVSSNVMNINNLEIQDSLNIENAEVLSPWKIPASTVKTREGFQSKRISVAFREHYGKSCRFHNQQQQQPQQQDCSGKNTLAIKNCSFIQQDNFESLCQIMMNAEGSNTPEFIFSSAHFKRQHPPIKAPFFKC